MNTAVDTILQGLNEAQYEAVTADSPNLLVLAGAGSGKTRVLVHRIAWLIQEHGVSPHAIMAVTFTNKAAREMRGRLEETLQVNTRGMWVGTFHGLAHRFLKQHFMQAKLPQNFQILDSDDQLRIIKRIYQGLNIDDTRWPPKQAQSFINAQKDEGVRAQYTSDGPDPYQRTMHQIYSAYEEECQRGGLVDFGELLLRAHELLRDNPELLQHYQERFRHILVDEFQDTNTIQYAWLRVLSGGLVPVTAVGDDDQSIYGWRGAKIENIQRYGKDFPHCHTVRLEQNYRSTSTILDAANAVIANNSDRLGKNLWTTGEEGEPISLYSAYNEQDEARFIVDTIQSKLNSGDNSYQRIDMAILYRSNAQSRILEEALLRANVPYRIYGGQRFYERLEIKNALAYLRLMLHPNNDAAFERVVNVPPRGIGNKTIEQLRFIARDQGFSLWEAAKHSIEHKALTARALNSLQTFLSLIDDLAQGSEQELEEIAEQVLQQTGLLVYHGAEKGEKGQARVENLKELVNAFASFENEDEEIADLQAFLDQAALDAGETQADPYEDAIQMMTLHSAKGLEFPIVFLAGMEEQLFPHKMSMNDASGLAEERRLAYVGITRAMEKLFLTHAEARRLYGSDNYNSISRFIREIPDQLVDEVRIKSEVTRPGAGSFGQSKFGRSAEDFLAQKKSKPALSDSGEGTGIGLGQRVRHSIFGEGTVLHFEGSGAHARVQINFDDEGSKWLVMAYAKLEAL
ncbi:MAG: DNA helicase II [Cellvibrionaceae bacterium]